jgi:hypothetical protein
MEIEMSLNNRFGGSCELMRNFENRIEPIESAFARRVITSSCVAPDQFAFPNLASVREFQVPPFISQLLAGAALQAVEFPYRAGPARKRSFANRDQANFLDAPDLPAEIRKSEVVIRAALFSRR